MGWKRLLVATAVLVAGLAVAAEPSGAGSIGSSRPFRVEGQVERLVSKLDNTYLVISPVTGGTPNALRWAAAAGRVSVAIDSAELQASPNGTYDGTVCETGHGNPDDICHVGDMVELYGHVSDRGPLGDVWVADIVRPYSGYGESIGTSSRILVLDGCGGWEPCHGTVSSGDFEGWSAEVTIGCNAYGFDAWWVLDDGAGNSIEGDNYSGTQGGPLINLSGNSAPPPAEAGTVTGGTGVHDGISGASRMRYDCGTPAVSVITLDMELPEGSPGFAS